MNQEIDLRSDTVTKPTAAMRHAMAEAEVADDVMDIDPSVDRLERLVAELLGKEAAIFMPSGTMTNQIAIRIHCDRGSDFLCEANCHIYHYEQGAFAQLSGLVAHTVAGDGGVLRVEQLSDLIRPDNEHLVRTRLVCIENTHNRWGGMVQPQAEVERVCNWAAENGLKRHLDGARLWNAAAATGLSEKQLAEPFDSVSVCFSKGLGAPVGSALAGSTEFIREAHRARKLFGGGMRQAGIIAAGALHAVEHHRERLENDHQHAQMLGEAGESCAALTIRGGRVDSNMVILEIDPEWGSATQLAGGLEEQGIKCLAIDPQAIRLVTHLDLSTEQVQTACDVIKSLVSAPIAENA